MSDNLEDQYGGFSADLKSVQFRQEREPLWRELERLMAVVERRGPAQRPRGGRKEAAAAAKQHDRAAGT